MHYYIPNLERLERCNSKTITFPWNFSECNGGSTTVAELPATKLLWTGICTVVYVGFEIWSDEAYRYDSPFSSVTINVFVLIVGGSYIHADAFGVIAFVVASLPFDRIRLLRSLLYTMN